MNTTPEILQQTFTEEIYRIPAKVIVVIPVKWSALDVSDIELLRKILNAVNLTLDGVHVLKSDALNVQELMAYTPTGIVSFGVDTNPSVPYYEVTTLDRIPVLRAHVLNSLDDAKKKNLWVALRQMFTSG